MAFPFTLTHREMTPSYDGSAPFADPFLDIPSVAMPVSVPAMLRHAEYYAITNETYFSAICRIAAYFITDIVVKGELGEDEKKRQKDYLEEDMMLIPNLLEATISLLVYGNQYTSVIQPIARYLVCPKCSTQYRCADAIEDPKFNFQWKSGFHGYCRSCKYRGEFTGGPDGGPLDIPDESRPPIFRSWNPHDMRPVYNEFLGQTVAYDWVIPADFRTEVKTGYNKSVLIETPWTHIKAALNEQNVRFPNDYVHHWREPSIAGLRFRGVGVPRAMTNYRQLYLCQILRRMTEVLAIGNIAPVRVVSPANTQGRGEEGDILKTTFLGDLRGRWNQILANHRADPNSVHFSPVQLAMQALGADARQLIPADVMNQALEVLLNGIGTPVEFYKMTMQTQAAPVGLRLIERYWSPLIGGLHSLLTFISRRLQFLMKWEKAEYTLSSVRLVDSIEMNQLRVQMAQAGLLSRTAALQTVDADFAEETKQKMEDMRTEQKTQADFEEKSDAFAFSRQLSQLTPMGGLSQGQAPPGQAPGAGGDQGQGGQGQPQTAQPPGTQMGSDPLANIIPPPGGRMTPEEMGQRADAAADALLRMPEGQRFGELQTIRKANPDFHKLVLGKMNERRSKMRSQGQQMIMQQQYGGGGGQ